MLSIIKYMNLKKSNYNLYVMFSNRKIIASFFILTLFLCQSGVCITLNNVANSSVQKAHNCSNTLKQNHDSRNNIVDITASPNQTMNSGCCYDSAIGSGVTPNQFTPVQFFISVLEPLQKTDSPSYLTFNYLNKGHPPGNPIYLQKSTYLI